jgi:hypothetical protein
MNDRRGLLLVDLVIYGREVLVISAYVPAKHTASVGKYKFWGYDTSLRRFQEEKKL